MPLEESLKIAASSSGRFLFGVNAWDPLVFLSVPVVLSGAALAAVWIPARRAARTDAAVALR